MNNEIRVIEPSSLWNNFTELNSVPRPSKREEKVVEFLIQLFEYQSYELDYAKKFYIINYIDFIHAHNDYNHVSNLYMGSNR